MGEWKGTVFLFDFTPVSLTEVIVEISWLIDGLIDRFVDLGPLL